MNAAGWTISIIAIAIALVIALRWERTSRQGRGGAGDEGAVGEEAVVGEASMGDHEFLSASWLAMARQEITTALSGRDLDIEPFTLSEEFTDPPPHLHRHLPGDPGAVGFFVRVGAGHVEVGDRPDPGADLRIISDYADALAVARDPDAAAVDPAEAERRTAQGRLTIVGDPARLPPVLQELDIHRLLAAHTA